MRDILRGDDDQVNAVIAVIVQMHPDILHLNGIDYDLGNHALTALRDALRAAGVDYPHLFALRPNSGMATGLDMDGDGRIGRARDAQGYGRFNGQDGMAILSRLPIDATAAQDFSAFPWKDLPGAIPPTIDGAPFPSEAAWQVQRLSSVGHWDVPVQLPGGPALHLLAFHATTPVFDGPEDRNGRRNHDEVTFWRRYLDGALPFPAPQGPVVILGDANLDSHDGDGRHEAIVKLLSDPRLQDPAPVSTGGGAEAANADQTGNPALDTADWDDPVPGNLRVDYVLPSAGLTVLASGVFWPAAGAPSGDIVRQASRHRLVWVDLEF